MRPLGCFWLDVKDCLGDGVADIVKGLLLYGNEISQWDFPYKMLDTDSTDEGEDSGSSGNDSPGGASDDSGDGSADEKAQKLLDGSSDESSNQS